MNKFALAVSGAVLGTALAAGPAGSQTVKIGFLATFSGPAGVTGTHLYDGFALGLDHLGG